LIVEHEQAALTALLRAQAAVAFSRLFSHTRAEWVGHSSRRKISGGLHWFSLRLVHIPCCGILGTAMRRHLELAV